MKYVRMGNSGLKLTEITFGSALTIGTESCEQAYADVLIDEAWDLGIRSFDVSNNYGMGNAEKLVARSLKRFPREEYIISTKGSWPVGESVYHRGLSRKHILWAFEESLHRMELDYVDLYYAHRYDPETPMEEIVRTYNYLISSGKVRYWATSEWPADALRECHEVCDRLKLEKPVIEQFIYSFAVRKAEDNGVMQFCLENNVGMLGFSPLCQGLLTGKYRHGIPAGSRIDKKERLHYDKTWNFYLQNKERIDNFLCKCDQYGIRPVDAAINWGIRRNVFPVLGASRSGQLTDTLSGLHIELEDVVWEEFERI